ncbi:MAG: hypothetical protein LBI69_01010 [Puniceicoccales bacterium]|nr:hypothetical protein [Puniceicoccales bacterium]
MAKCPSSPPNPPLQIRTDEEKFDMLYAETQEKLNSQSANPFSIVGELIGQGTRGMRILEKVSTEKILPNAEKIPEIIAAWMLNAAWMLTTSKNARNVKIQDSATNALNALSHTDPKFVAEILNHMKIIENLEKVAYLLEESPMDCVIKLLPILAYATQAKLLLQMDPINASKILCKLCEDDQMQFFGDNSKAAGTKNAAGVLLEIDTRNAVIILTQMASLKRMQCATIILVEMTLQSQVKKAAEILEMIDSKIACGFLSRMCSYERATIAVKIIKLMSIEKVAPIFIEMISLPNTKSAIVILKMIGPEVIVRILQKILALNQHEDAVKIFIGMDSEMMGNMLLFIKKAQKTQEAQEMQGNPVKILEIFSLLSQENAISVFKIMLKFEGEGNQLAADILATTINQERAMEILIALPAPSAAKIIKLMFVNELYQPRVLTISPLLAQSTKGAEILRAISTEFIVNIVLLMCENNSYAPAARITLHKSWILQQKCLMHHAPMIRTEMKAIKAHDAANKKIN